MIFGISSLKHLAVLSGLLCIGLQARAQEYTNSIPDSTIRTDSTRQIKILLIPFNPDMYFSDADKHISEASGIDPAEVRDRVSASLTASMNDQFGLYYHSNRITSAQDTAHDLELIFGSIQYQAVEVPAGNVPQETETPVINGLKDKLGKTDPRKKPVPQDEVFYMDVKFDDQRLLQYLGEKYDADYFVFINQFEIITDYSNCIDLQNRKYYREIRVHYSVYSREGKRVGGTMVVLPYHSSENNLAVIVKDNFGSLSHTILQQVYRPE